MTQTDPILCIGSALWDIIARTGTRMQPGFDVPGQIERQMGGVALNVALALVRAGQQPALLSYVGRDNEGEALISAMTEAGINCAYLTRAEEPTDSYLAVESHDGEVFAAVADCAALERTGDDVLSPLMDGRLGRDTDSFEGRIVVDGNLPEETLSSLIALPSVAHSELVFVPASPGKAGRLKAALKRPNATLYVNRIEAEIITGARYSSAPEAAEGLVEMGAARAVVTDGPRLVALAMDNKMIVAEPPPTTAITTTGAGDVFLAAHLSAEIAGADGEEALQWAVAASVKHISSGGAA